jgi:hypothetical protein
MGKIQGCAIRNTDSNKKYAASSDIVLMGAFASSDEPTIQPIPLKFEYTTFDKFYVVSGRKLINTRKNKGEELVGK